MFSSKRSVNQVSVYLVKLSRFPAPVRSLRRTRRAPASLRRPPPPIAVALSPEIRRPEADAGDAMNRKRDKPYFSRPAASSFPSSKRRRPFPRPDPSASDDPPPAPKPSPPPALVVMGLPPGCSVLDLKTRFEMYGSISRIRIDGDGVGYVTYRSKDSAEAAITASRDPSFGDFVDSEKVQVLWATDPLAKWREGVGVGVGAKEEKNGSTSKLLRAEVPLSRHGRGNKLASTIVNSQKGGGSSESSLEAPFQGRGIVAYDDIL